MATFDEFYRSLSEDSNKRGEYFEKVFIPWFLKTDPYVRGWSGKATEDPGAVVACIKQLDWMTGLGINSTSGSSSQRRR